jgi:anti-sigma regulatory factor (Ser/Thr protein kinase)
MGQVDSELVLTPDARAAKSARTLLSDCAGPFVGPRLLGDAQLLVTELVANSFVHGDLSAQDRIRVRVHLTAAMLRLEVRNPGIAGTIAPDRGHGLEMVDRISASWGVERGFDTCVWAEIARA